MKVLITCPPMLGMIDEFIPIFTGKNVDIHCPDVIQTLSEKELVNLIPEFDGWIIGDDPATRKVFEAGKAGSLKAAVKWGIGVDNVDFNAANKLGIRITNTPNMFGDEVADVAMSYITALARETFFVDREVRQGSWPKPRGISLKGKVLGLAGFGDIGRNTARRALAADMNVIAYDPEFKSDDNLGTVQPEDWPARIEECDFIIFTCSLTDRNRHMFNRKILKKVKRGVRIVNVARGPLIDENALVTGLNNGLIHSAALDVFEIEPLPMESTIRGFDRCILGSHNSSNTAEAVSKTSSRAIDLLFGYLV